MNNEPENAATTPEGESSDLEMALPTNEELNTQLVQQSLVGETTSQPDIPGSVKNAADVVESVSAETEVADVVAEAKEAIEVDDDPTGEASVPTEAVVSEPVAEVPPASEAEIVNSAPEPVAEVAEPVEPSPVAQETAEVVADEAAATLDAAEPEVAQAATETAEELDDNFIKEKVAAAKAAKKKAPARPRKPTKRERQKLPDLGDGSGYEPPEASASTVASNAEGVVATEEVEEAFWYAVHCYSGYENKVKHSLEQRIETMGMAGRILEIVVPTEEEIEVRDGKRKTVERRVFPGYVLVRMKMSEESWFVVRNTPGVTRFIGMGNRPQPLSQQEVNQVLRRMEAEAPKIRVSFKSGQRVRITDGPFADFPGLVDKIDTERAKVTVLVSFFGRETPVELDFLQVEKM